MKQRFSSLDVKVLVSELRPSIISLRLSNIYDLSSRIFLLKFAKPNHRQQLLIDSGFRCHLTQFARATAAAPSAFVARLRKFLKTRRVTNVQQVGSDRVIEIVFSEGAYRLFLEFYAGGNIILADRELNVLACLRVVSVEEGEEVRVGAKYMLERRQNIDGVPEMNESRVRSGLESVARKTKDDDESGTKKKRKTKVADALRKALATTLNELPPPLLEHAFLAKSFDATIPIQDVLDYDLKMKSLLEVLQFAREVVDQATAGSETKGYIVAKTTKSSAPQGEGQENDKENLSLMYEDFQPFKPKQFEHDPNIQVLEFNGFNATVDEFFSSIESQKLESRLYEREENAKKKLAFARQDHERRLGGLQQVQELNVRKAQAIEANLQRVQETTAAVNGLIAQGMDWIEIARLIEMEQARGNPVAEIIKLPLKLYENTVTLRLYEAEVEPEDDGDDTESESDESDEESTSKKTQPAPATSQALEIDIDLALSPWSNATQCYDQRRTAATKEQKTLKASEQALKSTERKIAADLKKGLKQEKELLRPVRKQFWFEKFYNFISSEGYLVLAGKDTQQSDILYKRYLGKGDVYVHAELNGAATVIIKNRPDLKGSPIPPSTLSQAGTFCIATSVAWESKAIMAAWWVNAEQVSKMAPNGDYLDPGMFVIKGQKNYLPPAQLLLGFGVMFQLNDESKARHTKNRFKPEGSSDIETKAGDVDMQLDTQSTTAIQGNTENHEEPQDTSHTEVHEDDQSDHESDDGETETYHNPLQGGGAGSEVEHSDDDDDEEAPATVEGSTAGDPMEDGSESDEDTRDEPSKDEKSLLASSANPAPTSDNVSDTASTMSKNKQAPQVRGKHGKKAKMKNKYAHQDEEDRALALRLLGSKVGQEKVQADTEKKVNRVEEERAAKERRKKQHVESQAAGKESEAKRKQQLDEGSEMMEPDELAELETLDSFVGSPLPGDEILDALVVCAPWDSLGAKLKWRVKLQPGAQKKGKAVREVLGHWNQQIIDREKKRMPEANDERFAEEKTARREGELVKALRDVEVVGTVPVMKLRTMIAGAGSSAAKGGGKTAGKGGRGGKGSKKQR